MMQAVNSPLFRDSLKRLSEYKGEAATTLNKVNMLYSNALRINKDLKAMVENDILRYSNYPFIDSLLKNWAQDDVFQLNTKVEARERRALPESFLDEVAKNTDRNLHTENLVLIAKEIGDKKLQAAANGVLALHIYFGELTPALSKVRQDLYKSIKAVAHSLFTNADELFSNL